MSLQVWLPLRGDLNNYGLSNVSVTNNGATVNDFGKIGKCYQLGQNKKITSVIDIQGTPISASFWIYLDSFQGTYDYILSLNNNGGYADQCIAIALESATKIVFCVGGNSSCFYNNSETLVDKWTHLAVTFDGSKIKGYLNGVEVCSLNSTVSLKRSNLTLGCRNGSTTYYTNCKLNDLRIYDHALSAKEVNEISKGLILHYTLSSDIINKNLISSLKSYSSSSYCAYQFNLSENFVAGQAYTFQLWDVNVSHSGKTEAQLGISIYWGGGSVNLKSMNGTSWFRNGHADYITFSITITSSQASGSSATKSWINIYNSVPSATGDKSMSIGKIKIENGNVATPYINFNESQQIVHDASGYMNNGTTIGDLSVSVSMSLRNDSVRYNLSTEFGSDRCILPSLWPSFLTNEATVSMWVKLNQLPPSNPGISMLYTAWYGFSCEITSSGKTYFRTNLTNSSVDSPQGTIGVGEWVHWVGVKSSKGVSLYLNGILIGTTLNTDNFRWSSNVSNKIGSYSNSYFVYGKLSDIRLYSTALSADDIKELYDTAAFIDNLGNVSCYEFEEKNENLLKYEYTIIDTNTSNTSTRGKYTVRNNVPAMAFKATDTYWSSATRHVMLAGRFKENTQYLFDLWLDTDDVVNNGTNYSAGFVVYYTDETTSGSSLRCTGSQSEPKGWQHKLYISTAGKTIHDIYVYYASSLTFFVRADSFITPLYDTQINKNGVIDTSQFIENTDVAFIGTGDVNSNKFLEI